MSSAFSGIVGHAAAIRALSASAEHPAPGYLFSGPDGVGKRLLAERFASLLLATSDELPATPLSAHPDFIRLEREEGTKEIGVKLARDLAARMQLTSARGGRRVAFVDDAHRLTEEAANALLKAVEEPPPGAVYLFLTSEPDRLPATLRSRLVPIPLERLPFADMRAWLLGRGLDEHDLAPLTAAARGCIGRAERLLADRAAWQAMEADTAHLLETLHREPIGRQCGALERLAQACEKTDDAETAWRAHLLEMMGRMDRYFAEDPVRALQVGRGLVLAWQLAGTTLSPRLGLEWSAVAPYARKESL
jgi:DNA polymerase-3 subunit delta'